MSNPINVQITLFIILHTLVLFSRGDRTIYAHGWCVSKYSEHRRCSQKNRKTLIYWISLIAKVIEEKGVVLFFLI